MKTTLVATNNKGSQYKSEIDITSLQNELIRKVVEELTPWDEVLVEYARQLAADKCHQGRHNLAACGLGKNENNRYSSLQLNVKRARESSVCAEAGLISEASMKSDEITTIVTFHGIDDRIPVPYIVPPCAMCLARLRYFAPLCMVIIEFECAVVKIPLNAFSLIPYPMKD